MTEMQMKIQDEVLTFQGTPVDEKYYDPNNFTHAAYEAQLSQAIAAGYKFIGFDDNTTARRSGAKTIILRHDEPFSLKASLEMAKINSLKGVSGTFFVNPDNAFYDLNTPEAQEIVQEISKLGQYIGLQIIPKDENGKSLPKGDIIEKAQEAKAKLESIITKSVSAITFEKTGVEVPADPEVAGMINVYSHVFADGINRKDSYNSNSNGMNLFRSNLSDFAEDSESHQHIHWLVHPCWIAKEVMLPMSRLQALPDLDTEIPEFQSYIAQAHNTGRVIAGDGFSPKIDTQFTKVMNAGRGLDVTPSEPTVS